MHRPQGMNRVSSFMNLKKNKKQRVVIRINLSIGIVFCPYWLFFMMKSPHYKINSKVDTLTLVQNLIMCIFNFGTISKKKNL